MLSTHEVTAITEERAGTSMLSTHEVTAITEERAGTRPRRALSAVLCVDAGVPPGAPPGLAREVRNPTRRSMRWSGEADQAVALLRRLVFAVAQLSRALSSPSGLDGTLATCAGLVTPRRRV